MLHDDKLQQGVQLDNTGIDGVQLDNTGIAVQTLNPLSVEFPAEDTLKDAISPSAFSPREGKETRTVHDKLVALQELANKMEIPKKGGPSGVGGAGTGAGAAPWHASPGRPGAAASERTQIKNEKDQVNQKQLVTRARENKKLNILFGQSSYGGYAKAGTGRARAPSQPSSPSRSASMRFEDFTVEESAVNTMNYLLFKRNQYEGEPERAFKPEAMKNKLFPDKIFFYARFSRELKALGAIEERINSYFVDGEIEYLKVLQLFAFFHKLMVEHRILKGKLLELEEAMVTLIDSRQLPCFWERFHFEPTARQFLYFTVESEEKVVVNKDTVQENSTWELSTRERFLVFETMNQLLFHTVAKRKTKTSVVFVVELIFKVIVFIFSLVVSLELTSTKE